MPRPILPMAVTLVLSIGLSDCLTKASPLAK